VWIFNGWYTPTFWKINLGTVDCTEAEMSLVVEGAFLTSSVYSNPIEERGIANLTGKYHRAAYIQPKIYCK
jgi:hypothetical protein